MQSWDNLSIEEINRRIKMDEFLMDLVASCEHEDTIPIEKQQALFAHYLFCIRLKGKCEEGELHGEQAGT